MQATESTESTGTTEATGTAEAAGAVDETALPPEVRPDLDMSQYIPDYFQPLWDTLAPYPGLLTISLVLLAYAIGKLIKVVVSRTLLKVTARTHTTADDQLVEHLTHPLVLTTVTLALMMVVSVFHLPQGLQDATLSVLATILLFSWLKAGLRTARILLELVGDNHHRFEIIQERTIPIFDMTIKMLLIGLGAYIFLMIWGDQSHRLVGICRCDWDSSGLCSKRHVGKPAFRSCDRCRHTL